MPKGKIVSKRAVKKLKSWATIKFHKAVTDVFETKLQLKGALWECMPLHF